MLSIKVATVESDAFTVTKLLKYQILLDSY